MKYLILILALLTPQIASARIGETKEACEKRYGERVIKDGIFTTYFAKGYRVTVKFYDSVCWWISYEKLGSTSKKAYPIEVKVVEKLMSIAGKGWEETSSIPVFTEWETDTMEAALISLETTCKLVIFTKAGRAREKAENALIEAEGL